MSSFQPLSTTMTSAHGKGLAVINDHLSHYHSSLAIYNAHDAAIDDQMFSILMSENKIDLFMSFSNTVSLKG